MGLLDFFRGRPRPGSAEVAALRQLSDEEFVSRLTRALRHEGYSADREGMTSGDGDLVLRRRGERTWLRYRFWRQPRVGLGLVRELYRFSQAEGAAGAKFVTTGLFTARARKFVLGKPIELLDGPGLLATMPALFEPGQIDSPLRELKTSFVPERAAPRQEAPPPVADVPAVAPPNCPRCGAAMRKKVARQGHAEGLHFWSCTRSPSCKGTRPA
jgi:restriction system protein